MTKIGPTTSLSKKDINLWYNVLLHMQIDVEKPILLNKAKYIEAAMRKLKAEKKGVWKTHVDSLYINVIRES